MAKKDKKTGLFIEGDYEAAHKELKNYRRKELQRQCIMMGLEFPNVTEFSQTQLMTWFIQNYHNPRKKELLAEYDHWFIQSIVRKGYTPSGQKGYLFHPFCRFTIKWDEEDMLEGSKKASKAIKESKPIADKKETKKREIDQTTGVVKGTKKALTYELAKKGLPVDKIIDKVTKQFPDANAGSIKIWIKRANS